MNIFVGNLAFNTSDQDIRQLFEPYGAVDTINIITDRYTGQSRGFGFVEMPDTRAAQSAIQGLQGKALGGVPSTSTKRSRANHGASPAGRAGSSADPGCETVGERVGKTATSEVAVALFSRLPWSRSVSIGDIGRPSTSRNPCNHVPVHTEDGAISDVIFCSIRYILTCGHLQQRQRGDPWT